EKPAELITLISAAAATPAVSSNPINPIAIVLEKSGGVIITNSQAKKARASISPRGKMAARNAFRDERDWQQYHTLENLVEALSAEAAELLSTMPDALKDSGFDTGTKILFLITLVFISFSANSI